jgi:hypothetical protein
MEVGRRKRWKMNRIKDQRPHVATQEDCQAPWGGEEGGARFRCYLCGYKFEVGDIWRFVYGNDGDGSGFGNFLTCERCDCEDIREKWKKHTQEAETKFWWL